MGTDPVRHLAALAACALLVSSASAERIAKPAPPSGARAIAFGQRPLNLASNGDCFQMHAGAIAEADCASAADGHARRAAYRDTPTFTAIRCRLGGTVSPSAAGETVTLRLVFSDGALQVLSTWSATIPLDTAAAGDLWSDTIGEAAPLADATVTVRTSFSNGATVFTADVACVLELR